MGKNDQLPDEAAQVLRLLQHLFADSLVGVYLHGSAVSRGLRPGSDVDLLAILNRSMSEGERSELLARVLNLSGQAGSTKSRPVELAVFVAEDLASASYPACCEFLYGEWLRDGFEAGEQARPVCDPELTLVLAQARQEAMALTGPEVETVVPPVAVAELRRAMLDVLPGLMESLEGDERNVLLTLARMLRTAKCGDFVSKDFAAMWAAAILPGDLAAMLFKAQAEYLQGKSDEILKRSPKVREAAIALRELVFEELGKR